MFKCSVCGISTTSVGRLLTLRRHFALPKRSTFKTTETNLKQHTEGRAHRARLGRVAQSERSVYVRGFPVSASHNTLQNFFQKKFEGYEDVWLSATVPVYALVKFSSSACALKVLQTPNVVMDGKKLVIKPRAIPPVHTSFAERKRLRLLAVSKAKKTSKNPQASSSALTVAGPPQLESEVVSKKILQIKSVDGQLLELADQLSLPQQSIDNVLNVCFDLLLILRQCYPRCIIVPFGSSVTGLGIQSSDGDLTFFSNPPSDYVDLLRGLRYFSTATSASIERFERAYDISFIPATSEKSSASLETESSASLETESSARRQKQFSDIANALKKQTDEWSRVKPLPNARCPIIKFAHRRTSLDCDLSVDAPMGVLNTRLVKAYCNFDKRVSTLIILIKFWTRKLDIPKVLLNSYALSLMTIYALQHCSQPLLPCLQDVGSWPLSDPVNRVHFENSLDPSTLRCVVTFASVQSLKPTSNSSSIATLLCHFFTFYGDTFKYKNHGVSIRKRYKTSRLSLANQAQQHNQHRSGKDFYSPLVVQDPFDLFHNVTRQLPPHQLHRFKLGCTNAATELQGLMEAPSSASISSLFAGRNTPSIPTTGLSEVDISHNDIDESHDDDDDDVSREAHDDIDGSHDDDDVSHEVHDDIDGSHEDIDRSHEDLVLLFDDPSEVGSTCLQMSLSQEQICKVLKGEEYSLLKTRLDELDWSSLEVQYGLGQLVLMRMIRFLTSRLDFQCEHIADELSLLDDVDKLKEQKATIGSERHEEHAEVATRKRELKEPPVGLPAKKSKRSFYSSSALEVLQDYVAQNGHYCNYVCSSDMKKLEVAKLINKARAGNIRFMAATELSSVSDKPGLCFKMGLASSTPQAVTFTLQLVSGTAVDLNLLVQLLAKALL